MPAKSEAEAKYIEEVVEQPADPITRTLQVGIAIVVVTILTVVVYAVLVGAFAPAAPRTLSESLVRRTEAAIAANKSNGQAWAEYARALYLSGSKAEARDAITTARTLVKDKSILWVNNAELDMTLRDGDNEKAVTLAEQFVKQNDEIHAEETKKLEADGVKVPAEVLDPDSAIQLYLLQATALGNVEKYKEAVVALDKVMRLNPEAADALIMRGYAKLHGDDKPGAKADFENALRYLPDDQSAKDGLKAASGE